MSDYKGWNTGNPARRGWYWVAGETDSVAMLAEWSGFAWTFPYQAKEWRAPVNYWAELKEPSDTPKIQRIHLKYA